MAGKCGSWCSLKLFVVIVEILTASAILAVSVFSILYVPALPIREVPIWAGAPLLVAGVLSFVFCCSRRRREKPKQNKDDELISRGVREEMGEEEEEEEEEDSTCVFVVKVLCVTVIIISIIVCLIAASFCAVRVYRLLTYPYCKLETDSCVCSRSAQRTGRKIEYSPVNNCQEVHCMVTHTVIASGSLSLIGAIEALTFAVLIFRSKYGKILAG